ncbi:MAG: MATE family efflux transporter [Anaerolineaceae bacterium]
MFPNKAFINAFLKIALPVALQNLFISSLGIVDTLVIGQMGEVPIAAIGLSTQLYMILTLVLFGITSGAAIFTAQYWGQKDLASVRRIQGVSVTLGASFSILIALIATAFPRQVLSFYTTDPAVIESGRQYLSIIGISYIPVAFTLSYASVLRTTGQVRLPVVVGIIFLCCNTFLNYCLILGKFGLPKMGMHGAALAACLARYLECFTLLLITYRRRLPPAASLRELIDFPPGFLRKYLRVASVVILNETLWSFGSTVLSSIYAHMSTDSIVAMNIARAISGIGFIAGYGTMTACAILVGNKIGEGDNEGAYRFGRWSLVTGVIGSWIIGAIMILGSIWILEIYQVPQEARLSAFRVIIVMGASQWLRTIEGTVIVGILRSGGDTLYSGILDVAGIWVGAVPLCYLGGIVLGLPVEWVALLSVSESLIKVGFGLPRILSRRWINNLS